MGLKQAKKIVVDLALVIECKEQELLPERLLCAWRLMRPDLLSTFNVDELVVCSNEEYLSWNMFSHVSITNWIASK